jgi:uncharacterized protein YkwD
MDLRTWQEAGVRAGSHSARHRARSPFSPLRPAPIAIGSLSTAAIAAFALVAPGLLHGTGTGTSTQLLDGMSNRVAPLSPGSAEGAPGVVTVTAPSPTSDSPTTPTSTTSTTSTATSAAGTSSSSPSPLTVRSTSAPPASPRPTQPQPSQSQVPTSSPSPSQTPTTAPPTTTPTPVIPVTPPPTNPTVPGATFDSSAAASSALSEIGDARSRQGVDALGVDKLLATAAKLHAGDMARTGDFSHIGSDGSDPFSRAAELGCYTLSQELIAHGRPGDDVIGALMRDPSSRRALLSFWNTSIGISAQLDRATGDVYWTIELGWA